MLSPCSNNLALDFCCIIDSCLRFNNLIWLSSSIRSIFLFSSKLLSSSKLSSFPMLLITSFFTSPNLPSVITTYIHTFPLLGSSLRLFLFIEIPHHTLCFHLLNILESLGYFHVNYMGYRDLVDIEWVE